MARSCSSMMSPTSSSSVPPALLAVHHHMVAATLLLLLAGGCHGAPLKAHFYRRSCPAAEAVVDGTRRPSVSATGTGQRPRAPAAAACIATQRLGRCRSAHDRRRPLQHLRGAPLRRLRPQLRARCGPDPAAAASNNATAVPMDPGSPARFDAHYYVNLKLGRGLFASDAALLADRRAAGMIHRLTRQAHFLQEFRNAVRKMGRVGVLTGEPRDCRAVNSR
ncbi:hypothetical protein C2845_PM06G30220 [Panicum miliaceum]|uniref:Plant heme peroxidase family profile domain-containing protein n=1 Tax=Panicum miliaceum TaxID=4540 RepID=A0A3L6R6D6_PANMI|nr:hypothetical protein C2845_PM06G30220 [Panicum miliaceum]